MKIELLDDDGMVISDKDQIVSFTNDKFCQITGYSANEIVGQNCRILQNGNSSQPGLLELRRRIQEEKECQVIVLNYRKDGTPFWNLLDVKPILRDSVCSGFSARVVDLTRAGLKTVASVDRCMPLFMWSAAEVHALGAGINGPKRAIQDSPRQPQPHSAPDDADQPHEPEADEAWGLLQKLLMADARREISFMAETNLPTCHGTFRVCVYRNSFDQSEPTAMIAGAVSGKENVALRVHDACFTSEVLGSCKCDCRQQLDYALGYIHDSGGIVVYLQQEGRGMGLGNKIKAYSLQERGFDTVDANAHLGFDQDTRRYDAVYAILAHLDIRSVRLMTNNPRKIRHLEKLGIKITSRIPVVLPSNTHSENYMEAKAARMGHMLGR